MKTKLAILLIATLALVTLVLSAALTGASSHPQTIPLLAAGGQAQHIALGNGRYLAIYPPRSADTTARQGPALDTYVDSNQATNSYCAGQALQVEYGALKSAYSKCATWASTSAAFPAGLS